jgi:hypothetical protein
MHLALLLLAASLGATSSVADSFVVHKPVSVVVPWLLQHPNAIADSMQCQVVDRNGDRTHVVTHTRRGTFEFVMAEHIQQGIGGQVAYAAELERSIQGGMTENSIAVRLVPIREGTQVIVQARATVPRLSFLDVQVGLNQARRSFRAMMEGVFR